MRGILNVVAVRAPGFGDRRKAILDRSCSIIIVAKLVSSDAGLSLEKMEIETLASSSQSCSWERITQL